MRNTQFTNEEFYHVYNRGVDKREIFVDGADFNRFYSNLYFLNDSNYRAVNGREFPRLSLDDNRRALGATGKQPLVSVVSFCLMKNHFHLLLYQLQEAGISKFLQRFQAGYTSYFNKRYERTGSLFEGPFKAKHINKDSYLEHIPRYIHLNVLDLIEPKWREGRVENWKRALEYLNQYPWVSHGVYMNRTQRLPVIDKKLSQSFFKSSDEYLNFLQKWCVDTCRALGATGGGVI